MKKYKNMVEIVEMLVGIFLFLLYRKMKNIEYERVNRDAKKCYSYYQIVAKWALNQSEKPVARYLIQNDYKHIAIYGAKEMGELLRKELNGTDIVIEYYVDRNAEGVEVNEIDVYYPEEELSEVDAVVVTPFFYFDSIKPLLEKKLKCPIISLSNIIKEI